LHQSANFCATVLNIFSKEITTNNTKLNVENTFWSSYETLESTGEMTLMMKFCLCFHNFSELWNIFSRVHMKNYFRQFLIALAFRKYKKDFNIRDIILVQDFCLSLDFLSDFLLISFYFLPFLLHLFLIFSCFYWFFRFSLLSFLFLSFLLSLSIFPSVCLPLSLYSVKKFRDQKNFFDFWLLKSLTI